MVGDIKPDIQLGPEDIQTYGVTAITDLLDQLAPEIRSGTGRGSEEHGDPDQRPPHLGLQ